MDFQVTVVKQRYSIALVGELFLLSFVVMNL